MAAARRPEQFSLFEPPPAELGWWEELPAAKLGTTGLRWYQREAYDACFSAWDQKLAKNILVQMATGLGKTPLFSAVATDFPGNVLALAHRDLLVDQGHKHLELRSGEMVEIEQAELRASSRSRVVMGSVPTLRNVDRLKRLGKGRFDLIIIDEAHHAVAPSYSTILEFYPDAKVLGVTATPDRTDKRALAMVFDYVGAGPVYQMDILDGIESGFLVPFEGEFAVMDELKLDEVKINRGDFAKHQLDMAILKIVESVVQDVRIHHSDRQAGILFFPGVRSAEFAAERLNALDPGSAVCITGKGPTADRDVRRRIMADFRAGRHKWLCNCMVATEGFDAPNVDFVGIARPTKSRSLYTQMAGRGGRPDDPVDMYQDKASAWLRQAMIAAGKKPKCYLRNYVPVDDKVTLISPVDVLGGRYTSAEVKVAKKKERQNPNGDPVQFLEEARRELREYARAMTSHVRSRTQKYDPFKVFHMDPSKVAAAEVHFGHAPATPAQKDLLKKAGITAAELENMGKGQATKLISTIMLRRKKKLATLPQLKTLQDWGIDNPSISFKKAHEAIGYLASTGWGKRETVSRETLDRILGS